MLWHFGPQRIRAINFKQLILRYFTREHRFTSTINQYDLGRCIL